jgi:hypothetical protein
LQTGRTDPYLLWIWHGEIYISLGINQVIKFHYSSIQVFKYSSIQVEWPMAPARPAILAYMKTGVSSSLLAWHVQGIANALGQGVGQFRRNIRGPPNLL